MLLIHLTLVFYFTLPDIAETWHALATCCLPEPFLRHNLGTYSPTFESHWAGGKFLSKMKELCAPFNADMFGESEKSQQRESAAAVTLLYDYGDMTTCCETDIEGY